MTDPTTATRAKFPWLVGGAFLTMFLVGLPGIYDRIAYEHSHTAGSDVTPWGLWVVAYIFFSGIAAGAFPIAALPHVFGYRRFRPLVGTALLVSICALAAAMLFVLVDLGRPERAVTHVLHPNFHSVMFWVIASYGMYSALLGLMSYFSFRPSWGESAKSTGKLLYRALSLGYRGTEAQTRRNDLILRVVGSFGLLVSLALGGGVGMLFAGLGGRSFWHSGLFPITFIVSALLSGAALVLASATLCGRGGAAFKTTLLVLARFMSLLLVVELVIIPVEALLTLNGGIPSHVAVLQVIGGGPFAWVFWVLQLGFGTIVALWLLVGPKQQTLALAAVAALYVLVGVFAFRLNFVIPQLVNNSAPYIPNLMEWNVVICGVGVAGLVFLIGSRLLPVFPANAPMEFELAAHEPQIVPAALQPNATAESMEVSHV